MEAEEVTDKDRELWVNVLEMLFFAFFVWLVTR